ncbi:2Fe-2S iron-sulfur cluster-binding protein [Sphingomonas montanisoli]|uniref:2Fe-2S iron-sulfur cluster binding domain-containing protein n=1 Tax=Sphingomonas montanisoli TaxID=2606412 RepID=A0A5D9CDP6_9SPHN|nr:2Fe-2S iron-sulfur cluster-binding protein [Sphingomonas montanisoli]TZG29486.1 2Fe-2S iron-sulfur cluster binding domain-containing protein [Sphingomonas montanisoli]
MIRVTYIEADGTERTGEGKPNFSVMEVAQSAGVEGIIAECGGACSCATCHVLVEPEWMDAVGAASEVENELLEFSEYVAPNSRLSCQIALTQALDGLVVRVPPKQG